MRLGRASVITAVSLLTYAMTASGGSAWVLWEHVRGVINNRVQDYWHLRGAGETRKECFQVAEDQIKLEMGEVQGLPAAMIQAERDVIRPGWSRERDGSGYKERAPAGQQSFVQHDFQCWPSGTDPRPRSKE